MNDESRVRLSYEDLDQPQVDQALMEIRKQKKAAAARAKAGAHPARGRIFRKFLFMILAGLLGLTLVWSLLHFGKSLLTGKPDPQESESGDLSKPPPPGKTKRI